MELLLRDNLRRIFCGVLLVIGAGVVCGAERFPPPEFESDYQQPTMVHPGARSVVFEYIDVAVLVVVMSLTCVLVYKKRCRKGIFLMMLASIGYFGFWREGCICSIGAIGNVVLSVFDTNYAIPLVGLLFFVVPLVFTLFFGRAFCGAVCPLGAIQDVVLLKPVALPGWLAGTLRLFAYAYLAIAVLMAATGSAFVICRYDPFIAIFRLGGNINMVVVGGCMLLIGVFVGRPYCRFLCPYGVILRQLSRLSRKRVTITPDECIKCRLCEDACPFGAISKPTAEWAEGDYEVNKRRLGMNILLVPVLVVGFGIAGYMLSGGASRANVTVRLADRIYAEESGEFEDTTDASLAFRGGGMTIAELYGKAAKVQRQFVFGSILAGAFVGLVAGVKLIRNSIQWKRSEYEADRAGCFSCGRCFKYCPMEHERLKGNAKTLNSNN